jgi:hypothetical protein
MSQDRPVECVERPVAVNCCGYAAGCHCGRCECELADGSMCELWCIDVGRRSSRPADAVAIPGDNAREVMLGYVRDKTDLVVVAGDAVDCGSSEASAIVLPYAALADKGGVKTELVDE